MYIMKGKDDVAINRRCYSDDREHKNIFRLLFSNLNDEKGFCKTD